VCLLCWNSTQSRVLVVQPVMPPASGLRRSENHSSLACLRIRSPSEPPPKLHPMEDAAAGTPLIFPQHGLRAVLVLRHRGASCSTPSNSETQAATLTLIDHQQVTRICGAFCHRSFAILLWERNRVVDFGVPSGRHIWPRHLSRLIAPEAPKHPGFKWPMRADRKLRE
jgi:hypothetical protein